MAAGWSGLATAGLVTGRILAQRFGTEKKAMMALPFFKGAARTREQMLAIDLGGRTTKAVHLQRKDERFVLLHYALLDAPIYDRNPSPELLSEHLRNVCQALEAKGKPVTLALGVNEAVARHTELPQMPVSDMRQVLKINSKNYLQQDLPGYVFDCYIIPPRPTQPKAGDKSKAPAGSPRQRVLVAGAKRQLVEDLQTAIKSTGLVADHIVPGVIGPVNAFERAMPEVFTRECVALVDIGFKNTTVSLLQEGELMLSRVVGIGGDRLTTGLAEALGISYAEAEGIKVGMLSEVQTQLSTLLLPLGRELRASIDFFEHQHDRPVTQVYISGGSARSEFIVQTLHAELMVECKTWTPLSFLDVSLPPQQAAEVDQVAPQLGVAIGAALAAF
jgi:type IV pilus assembly protein PilM